MSLPFLLFTLLALAWPVRGAPPAPAVTEGPIAPVDLQNLEPFRRELTLRLIHHLQDPEFRNLLQSRLTPEVHRLSLNRLVRDYAELWPEGRGRQLNAQLAGLDLDLRRRKGLEPFSQGLLGLEMIWPRDRPRVLDWNTVQFAVRPQRPRRAVTSVEAYDLQGRLSRLDAQARPEVPVILAGLDRRELKRAGLTLLAEGLRKAGYVTDHAFLEQPAAVSCAKLDHIRLKDDHEPWWKGAAEIYGFVAGVDPVQDKPKIKLVDLPYLDYADVDYYPNQVVIFWSDFRYRAADFQLWEQDSNLDYREILSSVLNGVGAAMTVAGAASFSWVPMLADAILKAMPRAWFKDNDDYVDTYYTLEEGRSYLGYAGAAGNATIKLSPYTLEPRVPQQP